MIRLKNMKECYYILRISQGIIYIQKIGISKIIYSKFKERMIS